MNPRQLRLVVGFLTVFVLMSVAPTLPDLRSAGSELLADVDFTDGLGNLLLVVAGGLVLSVGVIAARRRLLARPRPGSRSRPSIARALAGQRSPRAAGVPESVLARQLRKESTRGLRVPELARQFGLSQDAVRVALGRVATAPAAQTGRSFRSRKPASPVPAQAVAVARQRSPYQVMA